MITQRRFTARGCLLLAFIFLPVNTLLAQELSGTTSWAREVALSTPVAGVIEQVRVSPGQRVKQGELLLRLDQRPFDNKIFGLQAKIKKLEVLRNETQAELKRAEELYDRTLLSDHELELAKIDAVSAEADYRLTQSELSTAQLNREYSRLTAPFDALVLKRQAEKGQVVSPTLMPQVLLVLVSSETMKVRVLLESQELKKFRPGQAVKVKIADRIFPGTISMLGLEPEDNATAYFLEVEFNTQGKLIRSGEKAKVIL